MDVSVLDDNVCVIVAYCGMVSRATVLETEPPVMYEEEVVNLPPNTIDLVPLALC